MTKVSTLRTLFAATLVAAGMACTVHQSETPPLTGPSDLSLRIDVTATPDTINQDGGSQSSIKITATGPTGQPVPGVSLRVDTIVGGLAQDFGTLSARTVVTDSTGVARLVFTAPPTTPGSQVGTCAGLPGTCVSIVATPTGNDFTGRFAQSATIRLVPPGVILPPASTPTALYVFSPASPAAGSVVAFDASSSCAEGASLSGCNASSHTITSYSWDFGDGGTGTGKTVQHTYTAAGPFNATLTVTNDRGLSASTTKQIAVGAGTPPTALFTFGPTPVVVGAQTFFDASESKAAAGHTIVQYMWNWGDGDPIERRTGPTADHDFAAAGTFNVVLTVTDDGGQQASKSTPITVTGGPVAEGTVVKNPPPANKVTADGRASTAPPGSTITKYQWLWGDGTNPDTTSVADHVYAAAGAYTVRLTVTDSAGRTGTKTFPITVP